MAEKRDISMDQGTHFDPTFNIKNPDRSAFNLTGYTARMTVRRSYDSDEAEMQLTTENGKLSILPLRGQVRILIAPEDTQRIEGSGESIECVYDLEVESSAGIVTRVASGALSISREVTK